MLDLKDTKAARTRRQEEGEEGAGPGLLKQLVGAEVRIPQP